jgi:acyl carrier protein
VAAQNILERLIALVVPLAKGRVDVDADTELVGTLGLDSLQVMNLTLAVEDTFDVSVPVNVLGDVKTVGDLAHQIEQLVKQR